MKTLRAFHIVSLVFAVLAAALLFVSMGTIPFANPYGSIALNKPTAADSNGTITVAVDNNSRRALILNADGNLTGVIDCNTADSPIDAITDVCVSGDTVYLSGVRFAADSDIIKNERVVAFNTEGAYVEAVGEIPGTGTTIPAIKSLSNAPDGVVIAYEE